MKTRFTLAILLFLLTFTACSGPKEPSLKSFEKVRVTKLNMTTLEITGDAVFHNPNAVGCDLTGVEVDVKVNGVDAGTIKQTLSNTVPANADFRIPVKIAVPPQKIFEDWATLAIGVLAGLKKNEIKVDYAGKVTLEVAGVQFDVPIESSENIPLSK